MAKNNCCISNKTFDVIANCEKFLFCNGFSANYYDKSDMNNFDQNDLLLLPCDHPVRKNQQNSEKNLKSEYNLTQRRYVYDLHQKLYGKHTQLSTTQKIATTTAILVNDILKDRITSDSYCIYQSTRSDKRQFIEMELALFDRTIESVTFFYQRMIEFVLSSKLNLYGVPTYFSWGSFSMKFINPSHPQVRFGAMGYVRSELLKLSSKNTNKFICLLGLPVESLSKLLS